MIDMHRGGRLTSWEYVRVSWPDMGEIGQVPGAITHRADESMFTTYKTSGTLEYAGMPDLGDDMVRVYAVMSLDGETERMCIGTYRVATGKETIEEGQARGTADLYSMLSVADKRQAEETFAIDAGGNLLDAAARLFRDCLLGVTATPCAKTASAPLSWPAGTSYLDIANDIMEAIGYGSVDVDEYGNAVMAPYSDPSSKAPADTFSDTDPDVSDRSFVREFDRLGVPNVVVVTSTADDGSEIRAVAELDDPDNPYSTAARRMRIVSCSDVAGLSTQAAADEKAAELLKSALTQIETLTIGHAGKRFRRADAVQMDYRRSGYGAKYTAAKRTVKGTCDMDSETSMRRSVRLYER